MKKKFVPHQQSLELKELGFDDPCVGYYNHNKQLMRYFNPDEDWNSLENQTLKNSQITMIDFVTSPLWQDAFNFLWWKFNYYAEFFVDDNKTFGYMITTFIDEKRVDSDIVRKFKTENECKKDCIINIINKIKENV